MTTASPAMRDVFSDALVKIMTTDPRVLVLDGDLANSTKVDRISREFPDRFLEMGIAEQNMIGAAVGLADLGFIPWVSSFAIFLSHRALDPIRMLAAQTGANVKVAGAYSGILTGLTGKTHQDVQDIGIFRAMPGMVVIAPGDEVECRRVVEFATRYQGPVYVRLVRDECRPVLPDDYRFKLGAVHTLRQGADVTLLSTGPQTRRCLDAAQLLEAEGVHARVVHVPTIKPVDEVQLVAACNPGGLVCSVEEHTVLGGLGGLVAEVLAKRAPRRLVRIGLEDTWGESAPNADLLDRYGLSAARLRERVLAELYRSTPIEESTG